MSEAAALSLDELAERTGEDLATLRGYIGIGLLAAESSYSSAEVERVRLVQLLSRRGVDPAAVAAAFGTQLDLFDRYLAQVYPDGDFPSVTLEDAAQRTGVAADVVKRVWDAAGLGRPGERLTAADVEAIRTLARAIAIGFPEEALFQMIRVYADALNRVGEAEARLFHFYVHEGLRASGLTGEALTDATTQSSEQLLALVEPAILFFHRRGLARAVRDDLVLHLAEDAGLLPPDDETGRLVAAVCFIDLARFTALTEAMGDGTATAVLNRFSDLVRRSVTTHEGRIVKQIGDAFMLVFDDATSAVDCALDIRDSALEEPDFLGTRQGLHWGPVLYREGDYYGNTVNLAARIVAEAVADQVLISGDMHTAIRDASDVAFTHAGHRNLKHIAEPVEVYAATRPHDAPTRGRAVDPVCGMPIELERAVARLALADREVGFCSRACLQRFVDNPDRYT
ncbi:MAG: adenylate/guanylate cyclase domain-containing protein [Acidimicrobiales bacterium]